MDNRVNNNMKYIGIIIIVILLACIINTIKPKQSPSNNQSSTTSYSTELSKEQANRVMKATIAYVKKYPIYVNGNILDDGSYRYIESKDRKYIYEISIKYNPQKNNYADTTKIGTKSVFTLYDAATDRFSVYSTLSAAREALNQ